MGQECGFDLNHVACTSFGEGLKPGKAAKSFLHIVAAWKRLDRTCKDRYIATCAPAGQKKLLLLLLPTVCTCSAGQRFGGTVR